jgi:hypothetical protein
MVPTAIIAIVVILAVSGLALYAMHRNKPEVLFHADAADRGLRLVGHGRKPIGCIAHSAFLLALVFIHHAIVVFIHQQEGKR